MTADGASAGPLPLAGKAMVVTGGSRGIGAAIVRLAVAQGAEVVFNYHRSAKAAQALRDEMRAAYPDRQCMALRAQVSDAADMENFAEAAIECLGTPDALVNNAGVTRDSAFARTPRTDWDEVIETNLGSMYNATHPLIVPLTKRKRGAVINIASTTGVHGAPGQVSYAASKAGIIGFTKALAKEVAGAGVTVNAVAPGLIDTDMLAGLSDDKLELLTAMIPARRLGTADEVAHMVCFLASDHARYITGQVIEVAGGFAL
ncbi:MAG: SDR family oxidoreductase [Nocardiopsaceae bacterium]|nr:SDR family oxidoreductase [Nocardiopsaceae bacterium]